MKACSWNRVASGRSTIFRSIKLITLAALLGVGVQAVSAEDTSTQTPRIANGLETFDYPSVVSLVNPSDSNAPFCSGTLIGCSTVLTAAHCVCTSGGTGATCQPGGENLISTNEVAVAMQNGQTLRVTSIHVPPNYEFSSQADLAILKLTDPARNIRPTPINDVSSVSLGTPGTIVGYGITNEALSDNGIKREGDMITTSCSGAGVPDSEHICWMFPGTSSAGAPGTDSNTCPGDSGGPLFVNSGGSMRVAGVTSGGVAACHTADVPYDTDIFVNRVYIQNTAGADLDNTRCGLQPQVGDPGSTVEGFSGTLSSGDQTHGFSVPIGTSELRVVLNGTAEGGDIDLYLRAGSAPTNSEFDCRPFLTGNFEACTILNPEPGTWFARARHFSGSAVRYHLVATLFDGSDSSLFNISYNGFVNQIIRPAFIQLATKEVVITAQDLGSFDPELTLLEITDSGNVQVATNATCNIDLTPEIGQDIRNGVNACIKMVLGAGRYIVDVTHATGGTGNVLFGVTQVLK